jgi:hypothetical protein
VFISGLGRGKDGFYTRHKYWTKEMSIIRCRSKREGNLSSFPVPQGKEHKNKPSGCAIIIGKNIIPMKTSEKTKYYFYPLKL